MKKNISYIFYSVIFFLFSANIAKANDAIPSIPVIESGTNISLITYIGNIITFIAEISGIAVFIYIIYAGYKYIASQGDSGQTEKAKLTLTYAIVGLTVIILAYAIVRAIPGIVKNGMI